VRGLQPVGSEAHEHVDAAVPDARDRHQVARLRTFLQEVERRLARLQQPRRAREGEVEQEEELPASRGQQDRAAVGRSARCAGRGVHREEPGYGHAAPLVLDLEVGRGQARDRLAVFRGHKDGEGDQAHVRPEHGRLPWRLRTKRHGRPQTTREREGRATEAESVHGLPLDRQWPHYASAGGAVNQSCPGTPALENR
jgi:hypothetical protein